MSLLWVFQGCEDGHFKSNVHFETGFQNLECQNFADPKRHLFHTSCCYPLFPLLLLPPQAKQPLEAATLLDNFCSLPLNGHCPHRRLCSCFKYCQRASFGLACLFVKCQRLDLFPWPVLQNQGCVPLYIFFPLFPLFYSNPRLMGL